jgi:hypothetical protein
MIVPKTFESMMSNLSKGRQSFFLSLRTDHGTAKSLHKIRLGFVEKLEMDESASPEYYVYLAGFTTSTS